MFATRWLARWLSCVAGSVLLVSTAWLHAQAGPNNASQLPDVIKVCADENGFPPFTFDRGNSRGVPEGYNIELLDSILNAAGKRADYHMLPWLRCLAMAETGDVDILLDVQDTAERQRALLMPAPHYGTRAAMVALDSSRHVMQMITSKERMLALDICRLSGWDTSRVASPAELAPAGEPHNLASAITMLRLGRCDMLIYTAELFSGGLYTRAVNPDDFEGITFHLMPWQPERIPKFFGVSRKAPAAQAIYQLLDDRIRAMDASGELQELLANYVPAD